ncbi:cysteine methyltransferase [Nocardioides gansuensis]|uniref:Cysteine methyltransferase n=1 Tax=Nocardioides gansuensis TaxID=2138300 RepID=A0A2T8F6J5_9ACTN|nr:MGMT family protein [Nocardioides gansuensis]PVG81330.1 cysteine methyltransferase [Nocardioides gansuensis]
MDDLVAELVLRAAEQVPRGRVASYGDVAGLVGTGPRHVGAIMSRLGSDVPWWRITNSYGDLPAHLRDEARPRWADEGITWKPNGLGCRIADFRCDLVQLADDWERATAGLGGDVSR